MSDTRDQRRSIANEEDARSVRVEQRNEAPAWIVEMHQHFHDKGFFRPEDLRRVLGNPLERVDVPITPDPLLSGNTLDDWLRTQAAQRTEIPV